LYLANVLGAALGTVASALVMIELLGFTGTGRVAASVNAAIALCSFGLARLLPARPDVTAAPAVFAAQPTRWRAVVLFTTGFCSLAMEVMWVRGFTIILETTIYAFAAILATYLLATWIGSALYRIGLRDRRVLSDATLLALAAACALLPVVFDDPRVQSQGRLVLASIFPLCAVLGYLMPKLVDDYAGGDPRLAGRCYAINILGGILGPLVAGYVLVVLVDVRVGLLILALPLCGLAVIAAGRGAPKLRRASMLWLAPMALLLLCGATVSRSYEDLAGYGEPREVHRDPVATAIAYGAGMQRHLLVNGVGITILTPITKVMAHLPLALLAQRADGPRDGLVICFGMGTTFRSMVSWGIDTTVVDLTRSVVESFPFFHEDAAAVLAAPNAHVVVDDGRRFLLRSERMFDVIVIDPPPPVEAAGSSLLYSTGFYAAAKRRLRPGGILAQWVPGAEPRVEEAMIRALQASFPHLLVLRSIEGWGLHFLASMQPIPAITAADFAARMPPAARRDLVEWGPAATPEAMAGLILAPRLALAAVAPSPPTAPAITDDRPFNEYFLLRRLYPGADLP
jgi:predicted membrane-bound spermidine synthase